MAIKAHSTPIRFPRLHHSSSPGSTALSSPTPIGEPGVLEGLCVSVCCECMCAPIGRPWSVERRVPSSPGYRIGVRQDEVGRRRLALTPTLSHRERGKNGDGAVSSYRTPHFVFPVPPPVFPDPDRGPTTRPPPGEQLCWARSDAPCPPHVGKHPFEAAAFDGGREAIIWERSRSWTSMTSYPPN